MSLRSFAIFLILPVLASCNFHSESVCAGKPSLSLEKFLGEFEFLNSDEDGEHVFKASLSVGEKPATYTLIAAEGEEAPEAIFVDAQICQIGKRVFAESKSVYDPESLTLTEISESRDGEKLIVGMLLYNQDKLQKAGIEFEDVSLEGFEGFATKVNNQNVSAEELVKNFEVGSFLQQK